MQQEQPQYYRAVKASERPAEPNKDLYLIVFGTTKDVGRIIPETGKYQSFTAKSDELSPDDIEYLEPIHIPDAERLREVLSRLYKQVMMGAGVSIKMLSETEEALSAVGDGWVRVEEKQPEFGEMVWVYDPETIFPNQYMATWNPCKDDSLPGYFSVGALQGQECWYVTHWRPLPSPPLNK